MSKQRIQTNKKCAINAVATRLYYCNCDEQENTKNTNKSVPPCRTHGARCLNCELPLGFARVEKIRFLQISLEKSRKVTKNRENQKIN